MPDPKHTGPQNAAPKNINAGPAKSDRPVFRSIMRGLSRRCANCGVGTILTGYLQPVAECAHCGEDFRNIRADDGPAWVTILVLGHVIVPAMLYFGRDESIPVWMAAAILSAIMLVGVYLVLPRAKGMFIALIWATGATGEPMTPQETGREDWTQSESTHNKPK